MILWGYFMSNFRFDYNDIHKQVAIADLSDEQIQELFTLLQTKRSAKPQLTREEKAFFQCCREHRSYANNKDTRGTHRQTHILLCAGCPGTRGQAGYLLTVRL